MFKDLFELLPQEGRNEKKMIGYLSMYMSGTLSNAARAISAVTNKSFDTLPDNIQNKLLDTGNNISDFLNKLKVCKENMS